eukprot:scaffold174755_cov37-Prasinocladus_malaysianus.AAC.1
MQVRALCWSPDSQSLAYGGALDSTSIPTEQVFVDRIYDESEDAVQVLGHLGPVSAAAWSADGRLIATVADDDTLRVWS